MQLTGSALDVYQIEDMQIRKPIVRVVPATARSTSRVKRPPDCSSGL